MNIKHPLSFFTGVTILGFILLLVFSNIPLLTLSWDTMGYHVYWSQLLVHHDIHIYNLDFYKNIEETYQNTSTLYQFVGTQSGAFITKYPYGWALLNAPFILLGHLYAVVFNYPIDGFSIPYQIAALCSSLFYFYRNVAYKVLILGIMNTFNNFLKVMDLLLLEMFYQIRK
jgi:hypothetical protein